MSGAENLLYSEWVDVDEEPLGLWKTTTMARKQQDIREINAAINRFMREPEAQQIGSPFRRNVYAQARLKGKSPEEALVIARFKPETK